MNIFPDLIRDQVEQYVRILHRDEISQEISSLRDSNLRKRLYDKSYDPIRNPSYNKLRHPSLHLMIKPSLHMSNRYWLRDFEEAKGHLKHRHAHLPAITLNMSPGAKNFVWASLRDRYRAKMMTLYVKIVYVNSQLRVYFVNEIPDHPMVDSETGQFGPEELKLSSWPDRSLRSVMLDKLVALSTYLRKNWIGKTRNGYVVAMDKFRDPDP